MERVKGEAKARRGDAAYSISGDEGEGGWMEVKESAVNLRTNNFVYSSKKNTLWSLDDSICRVRVVEGQQP